MKDAQTSDGSGAASMRGILRHQHPADIDVADNLSAIFSRVVVKWSDLAGESKKVCAPLLYSAGLRLLYPTGSVFKSRLRSSPIDLDSRFQK